MTVKVDISEVESITRGARKHFRGIPSVMRKIGDDAARYSAQNHIYQNRTGAAEKNTKAITEVVPNAVYTLVTINVPYGSFLMKGGRKDRDTSLTLLEDAIKIAERELDHELAK